MEETEFECPKCGGKLMDNNYLYACEHEGGDDGKCDFKLWKKQKLLGEEIDDLIFQQLNSEEGYTFDRGIMRIDINNTPFFTSVEWSNSSNSGSSFDVKLEFHLLEITTKDGRELQLWKDAINNPEDNANRKTIFKNFLGHDITEEEAIQLFAGETLSFTDLTSKAGKEFSANGKLEFNDERKNWGINLIFNS